MYIVDYYTKFPVVKKIVSLSANDLVHMAKMIFSKFELPQKIISDAGTNFVLENFRNYAES